jgi:hypothetical protein
MCPPSMDGITFAKIEEPGLEAWLAGLREELSLVNLHGLLSEEFEAPAAVVSASKGEDRNSCMLLLCFGQRADLIGAEPQLDAVTDLLEPLGIDGNHLVAKAEKAADLYPDGLNLAVRPSHGFDNPADILVVGT